jgi:predicted phosphodiesterase
MDISSTDNRYGSKVQDLGAFTDPVLICGGAYSNLEALEALFEVADKLVIPSERIIHTGDVVAYCADPAATAKLLRDRQVHAIQGNVEESLSASAPDCGCGFNEGTLCDKLSGEWFAYTDARIDDDTRHWMGHLPQHLVFEIAGKRARVVHGSMQEINRFIFASLPDPDFEAEFSSSETDDDIIISGHSGIPFTRRVGAKLWHNSGSLGLPANDGTPRVWYSILTPKQDSLRFDTHSLDYDYETARGKMIRANICAEYAEALVSGVWPSLDVLPETERRATGSRLDFDAPLRWETNATVSG